VCTLKSNDASLLDDVFVTEKKAIDLVEAMCKYWLDFECDGLKFKERVFYPYEEHESDFGYQIELQHCFEIVNVVHVLYHILHILRSASKSESKEDHKQLSALSTLRQLAGLCYECSRHVQIRTTKSVEKMETVAFHYTWMAWYNVPFVIQCSVLCLCKEVFDCLLANFQRELTIPNINLNGKNIAIPRNWIDFKRTICSSMNILYKNMINEVKTFPRMNNDDGVSVVLEFLPETIKVLETFTKLERDN